MDLYLPSSEPNMMTLQEMIECDIKGGLLSFEDGFPLDSLLGSSDLDLNPLEAELDLKALEPLFDPLDRLDDMDVSVRDDTEDESEDDEGRRILRGRRRRGRYDDDDLEDDVHDTVSSWMNMSSMTNYNLDLENSVMVDPSSVIPSTLPSRARNPQSSSMGATPPYTVDSSSLLQQPQHLQQNGIQGHQGVPTKQEDSSSSSNQFFRNRIGSSGSPMATQVVLCPSNTTTNSSPLPSTMAAKNTASLSTTKLINGSLTSSKLVNGDSTKLSPLLCSNSKSTISAVSSTSINSSSFHQHSTISHSGRTPLQTFSRVGHLQPTKASNGIISTSKSKYSKLKREKLPEEKAFPKPAYSYSCLIALALKNSSSGSLPVSEIYSFMCEHFPYFRTAPNGWKNSVRHNLSLNKCFEKIEKPVVSGGNQRKGCLWALNPDRAHKMDDEVQKWSKKGLQEIKQSMTYPEALESLERGEMKFETSSGASSCSEDEEEELEEVTDGLTMPAEISGQTTHTIHPLKLASTVSSPLVAPGGLKTLQGRILTGGVRAPVSFPQQQAMNGTATLLSSQGSVTPQIQIRKPLQTTTASVVSSVGDDRKAAKFIAATPHSVSEINIQSNGSIVDDFGNEISLEGDMSGVLLPHRRSPSRPTTSSSSSVILRQAPPGGLPATLRAIPRSASNFAAFAAAAGASPHQNGTLNRLVLTTAKPT